MSMNKHAIIKRIKQSLKILNINQSELARRGNVSRAHISMMLSGDSKINLDSIIPALSDRINIDWLVTGRGNMLVKINPSQDVSVNKEMQLAFKIAKLLKEERDVTTETIQPTIESDAVLSIPLPTSIAAGPGIEGDDLDHSEYIDIPKHLLCGRSGTFFALHIKGDSMEPELKDGDIAVFRQQSTLELRQIGAFSYPGDTGWLRICKLYMPDVKHKRLYLTSLNPQYPPISFEEKDQIHTLGILILSIRSHYS